MMRLLLCLTSLVVAQASESIPAECVQHLSGLATGSGDLDAALQGICALPTCIAPLASSFGSELVDGLSGVTPTQAVTCYCAMAASGTTYSQLESADTDPAIQAKLASTAECAPLIAAALPGGESIPAECVQHLSGLATGSGDLDAALQGICALPTCIAPLATSSFGSGLVDGLSGVTPTQAVTCYCAMAASGTTLSQLESADTDPAIQAKLAQNPSCTPILSAGLPPELKGTPPQCIPYFPGLSDESDSSMFDQSLNGLCGDPTCIPALVASLNLDPDVTASMQGVSLAGVVNCICAVINDPATGFMPSSLRGGLPFTTPVQQYSNQFAQCSGVLPETVVEIFAAGDIADFDDTWKAALKEKLIAQYEAIFGSGCCEHAFRIEVFSASVKVVIRVLAPDAQKMEEGLPTLRSNFDDKDAAAAFLPSLNGQNVSVTSSGMITVYPGDDDDYGLSTGAIVGIAIGATIGGLLIFGAVAYLMMGSKSGGGAKAKSGFDDPTQVQMTVNKA